MSTTSLPPTSRPRYALCGAPRTRISLSSRTHSSVVEPLVVDVRVRAEDARAGPREQLAELVAERRPGVVGLGLERHPEDADRLALEAAVAPLERRHDVGRQALVDLHRGLAHREVVGRERGELHRVLEQARAGGEARAGQVGGARVVVADRVEDVRVVDAGLVGDHEELVRDGELHVAPRVREQLRELGLLGRRPDRLRRRAAEQRLGPLAGARRVGADDLGQRPELLEGVALGDPLRAEREVDLGSRARSRCWATYAVVPG